MGIRKVGGLGDVGLCVPGFDGGWWWRGVIQRTHTVWLRLGRVALIVLRLCSLAVGRK